MGAGGCCSPPGPDSPPLRLPSARRGSARRPPPPTRQVGPGPRGRCFRAPGAAWPPHPGPARALDPGHRVAVPREVMRPPPNWALREAASVKRLVLGAWTIYPKK